MTEEGLTASLRGEQVDEGTKRQMMEILRRFGQLDMQEEEQLGLDAEPSDLGFLGELTSEQVAQMSAEELAVRIGPEALLRFQQDLKSNPQFIEAELQQWRPWWRPSSGQGKGVRLPDRSEDDREIGEARSRPHQPAIPEALEEVPPLSELTPDRPPEALWNNLIELLYLYAYLIRVYSEEATQHAVDFCRDFLSLSQVLPSARFTHPSVLHAIRAVEAAVAMESELYLSEETKALIVEDVFFILGSLDSVLAALGDLQRLFERTIRQDRANFLGAKKLYFYNVWLHDEARSDRDLADTILVSLRALTKGYLDRISSHPGPSDDLSALKLSRPT